jgi:hypothetical protein
VSFSRNPLDLCRILGLGVFCFSLVSLLAVSTAHDASDDGRNEIAAVTDPANLATGTYAAGSRIYIDPATGRRAKPPMAVAEDPTLKAPAVPLAALRAERRSDGTVGVRLHGNFRSYSVATVSPSGVLTQDCFDDSETAAAAVRESARRSRTAPERIR